MATTVKTTIGDGKTYTTVSAWEAALPADITVTDEIHKGVVYDAANSGATVTGTVCDATRYLWLVGYIRIDFAGPHGAPCGAIGGVFVSGASAVMVMEDLSSARSAIGTAYVTGTAAVVTCKRVISSGMNLVSATAGSGFRVSAAGATLNCDWCLSIEPGTNATLLGAGFHCQNGTLTVRNCLNIGGLYGFRWVAGTMAATNCYSGGAYTADYNGTITKTTCYSSDTTASGDATNQISVANMGFRARRHPNLIAFFFPRSYAATAYYRGKRSASELAVYTTGRSTGTFSGDTAIGADTGLTCTTGYGLYPATGSLAELRLGTGDRTAWAKLTISSGPAANEIRGILWVNDGTTANDQIVLRTDADGYFVAEVTSSAGVKATATSTTKIGDLADGDHLIAARLSGTTLHIDVAGVSTGSADASLLLAFTAVPATAIRAGHYNPLATDYYLGANVAIKRWGVWSAAVAITSEPEHHLDNSGWNWDCDLTEASSETAKTGGTAWATPGTDLLGRTVGEKFPIGPCMYDNKAAHVGKGRYSHNQSGGGSGWHFYR